MYSILLKTKRPVVALLAIVLDVYLIVVVATKIIDFHRIINALAAIIWIITTNTLLPTYHHYITTQQHYY